MFAFSQHLIKTQVRNNPQGLMLLHLSQKFPDEFKLKEKISHTFPSWVNSPQNNGIYLPINLWLIHKYWLLRVAVGIHLFGKL